MNSSITTLNEESNKIYLGDCREILNRLKCDSVDISFTSPPYNRKRDDKYSHFRDVNKDWFSFNVEVINHLLRVTKRHVIYNLQANYYNREDVYNLIGLFSSQLRDIHIWQKSNPMPASGYSVTNAVEYFLILGNKPLRSNKTYTKNIITTSVNSKMPKDHKAVMKPDVAKHFIENFSKKNDVVLDCFLGYGTTAIESIKLGRKYIGIEKNEIYYNNALKIINETERQC